MQYVAGEMQKDEHFRVKKIPLLIGGATTSRVHTAVKIAPHYDGPVVYVPDASRSVSVAQGLLGAGAEQYVAEVQADYENVRQLHARKKPAAMWTMAQARANKAETDWDSYRPPVPKFTGRRVIRNIPLADLLSGFAHEKARRHGGRRALAKMRGGIISSRNLPWACYWDAPRLVWCFLKQACSAKHSWAEWAA